MGKILAFAGSNHQNSINYQLVKYTVSLLKNDEVTLLDIRKWKIPVYSIDLDPKDTPAEISKLIQLIEVHDGCIISTPEHNGTISAFLKNITDWLSRRSDKVFAGKPVMLMSTSPSAGGAKSSLNYLKKSLPYQGAVITSTLSLPSFYKNFSDGQLQSDYQEILKKKIADFKK